MSEHSDQPSAKNHGDPLEDLIKNRRAEGGGDDEGHVVGQAESSYTDNPSLAAQEGQSRDVSQGAELDYAEEPGVGGTSTDHTSDGS